VINLKIGIIHQSFNVFGGTEYTTACLIEALKKTNHNSTLYTFDPGDIQESENFKIFKMNLKKFRFFKGFRWLLLNKRLFKAAENEDVLVISGGGLSIYKTKAPRVICYCHSPFDRAFKLTERKIDAIQIIERKIQSEFKERLEFLKDPKVQLVSNSCFTRDGIKSHIGKNSKVIFPPVDIKKFSSNKNAQKQKKVITISRIEPEKNLEFGVNVANKTGLKHEIGGVCKLPRQIKFYDKLNKKINHSNVSIHVNLSNAQKENLLISSKVYFQPSEEDFGIAVVEGISAGCIPIVPNNSGHLETVPFSELRFDNEIDAVEKLRNAASGKFDYLLEKLKKHKENFSKEIFQSKMLKEIENVI